METVKKMEEVGTDGKPAQPVKIVNCGETSEAKVQDAIVKDSGNSLLIT